MKYRIIQIEIAVPDHTPEGEVSDFISNTLPQFQGEHSDIIADWQYTGIEFDADGAVDLEEGEIFALPRTKRSRQVTYLIGND